MKPKLKLSQLKLHPESGFTLIESLLAVVVVAILLVGVGPIIAFSAATRVQARRVELGLQSARGFMSGVASSTIDDPPINQAAGTGEPIALQLKNVAVPQTGALNCPTANDYCTVPLDNNQWALYCVDQDGDSQCTTTSQKDLVIQAFGLQSLTTATQNLATNFDKRVTDPTAAAQRPDAGYQLGIRVYRANAFGQNPGVTLRASSGGSSNRAENQASTVTSGMGSRALPIAEMTTEVNTGQTDLDAYCQRINTGANQGSCNI